MCICVCGLDTRSVHPSVNHPTDERVDANFPVPVRTVMSILSGPQACVASFFPHFLFSSRTPARFSEAELNVPAPVCVGLMGAPSAWIIGPGWLNG